MANLKYSRQRASIMKFLAGRTDHPTAETIYENLKIDHPHLSLGTVYRNLSLLTELGEIRKVPTDGGPDHFDSDLSPHYHFICRCCRQVCDIRLPELDQLLNEHNDRIPGQIDHCDINVYGICDRCTFKA